MVKDYWHKHFKKELQSEEDSLKIEINESVKKKLEQIKESESESESKS